MKYRAVGGVEYLLQNTARSVQFIPAVRVLWVLEDKKMNKSLRKLLVLVSICFPGVILASQMRSCLQPDTDLHQILSTQPLDNDALMRCKDIDRKVNMLDSQGYAPLHYLVAQSGATVEQVDFLVRHGARVDIKHSASGNPPTDPHGMGTVCGGASPGDSWDVGYYPNKEVVQRVFYYTLNSKLHKIIAGQEKQAAEEALKIKQKKWAEVPFWRTNEKELS